MALYYFSNTPHATRADGTKVNTLAHYEYICREGSYAKMTGREEDLVLSRSGNMPDWAANACQFWQAAEVKRQINGRAYREIRLALQEELSLADNIALVEEFLDKTGIGKHHAFSYAVHDKTAAFDQDHRNIHVHIMFCEKTIEKDRPLGPDLYFKHYYLDQQGNPCAGYRADRYYQSVQGTRAMRKLWADIVNARFKAAGMEISISEKSLQAQREELIEQGRHAEAALLDRIPAPHLGDAYRNPKTIEKIREREREIEAQCDDPACTADEMDETDQQDSIAEQKIVMFATDAVLRKVIAEIRREQERVRREEIREREAFIAEALDEQAAEEWEAQPVTVTAADVYDALLEKQEEFAQKEARYLAEYKQLQKQMVAKDNMWPMAIEKVIGKGYWNVVKQHKRLEEQIKPVADEYYKLARTRQETEALRTQYAQLIRRKQAAEADIQRYKGEIEANREAIEKVVAEFKQTNEQVLAHGKKLYRQAMISQKQKKLFAGKAEELKKNVPMDHLYYCDSLHNVVLRSSQIEGRKAVKDFPIRAHEGRAYAVIDDLKLEPGKAAQAGAVMLGDTMKKGQARLYMVTVQPSEHPQGFNITGVDKTGGKVRMYGIRQNEMTMEPGGKAARNVQRKRQAEFTDKLNHMLQKAVDDTKARYHAWWDDSDPYQKKNEAERVEKEMYTGWSL